MSLTPCPHCGEPIFVLPDGQMTTPAVVNAVIERYEELQDWQEALADDEERAWLAEAIPVEDLDGAFQLLDGLRGDGPTLDDAVEESLE